MPGKVAHRRPKTTQHELCKNEKPCAFLLSPGIPPQDLRYHMSSEHCRLCGLFWDRRSEIACKPRRGLKP